MLITKLVSSTSIQNSFNSEEFKLDAKQQQIMYKCDFCATKFTDKQTLGYHLNVHAGRTISYKRGNY